MEMRLEETKEPGRNKVGELKTHKWTIFNKKVRTINLVWN